MAIDNVTFLIMWFCIMFVTLSSGILVIMYRVGCFKCQQHKIGIGDFSITLGKLLPSAGTGTGQTQTNADPQGSSNKLEQQELPEIRVPSGSGGRNGSGGNSQQPSKLCTVCGEPMSQDEDPSDNSHPACRDMDASFL